MGIKASSFKTLLKIPKKNSKDFYNLIANSNLAVVILDSDFVVNFRNDRYYSLLKLDRSPSILNKTPHEINQSKKPIYAQYQCFYKMKTMNVLKELFKEIEQSNTCEVIFTYQILKPEVHHIHTRVTMRNITIGNRLFTMCSIVKLEENPLKNPFYLLNDKDNAKENGDQNLLDYKKKQKKIKNRNNKSLVVFENENENETEEGFDQEQEKEKNIRFIYSNDGYSNPDLYSESLWTDFGESSVEEF
ncbi:hypothetical protein M0812_22005 [Anaeramoeba flamelloides]|uniref:PAS domain-containing protein n=1 Tax=Anaeramoeba flamelloides TaxID=1746091 RepID=A0AAV7YW25_9EUKA|nr:hypothetical protein M0812_22005 [Anaeramoeba flamelloides]